MVKKTDRKMERQRRHMRVRRKISGTAERPRLCALVAASTLDKEIKTKHANKAAAKEVGTLIAKRAADKKIVDVVFDRGGYIYHGVVKELAEAAREGGLKF